MLNTVTLENVKVNAFLVNGEWNIDRLCEVVPYEVVALILKIPLQLNVQDKILFKITANGKFSFKKLWELFRHKEEINHVYKALWHNTIPVSYSLLSWRCLKGYLPVDTRLWNKGFYIVSKCQCCANIESIFHIFINSTLAQKVWNHFSTLAGVDVSAFHGDLKDMLALWFTKGKGHIFNLLPILIIWYLWKARNESKHEGIKMDENQIIANIRNKMLQLISVYLISYKNFKHCNALADYLGINAAAANVEMGRVRIVYWVKPNFPFVKLNTDASVGCNSVGIGGIIRDHLGNPLDLFFGPLAACSVMSAELQSLSYGLERCLNLGFISVNIEVDATSVIYAISEDKDGNPHDFYTIRKIKSMMNDLSCVISHTYREGNACADWLAKYGAQSTTLQNLSVINLPSPLKGMIQLDKVGFPYIRHG
ncbi:hypothetical protein KFK09_006566 [Dendrobium nobile]|uniref:RNase H type-1 domain-containing protein n=1 Tax=Dendrobium nobile TaxID=94219 RepID=A0A8T3BSS0_DENNO|nr:hypothetical protein KFK09_006566 [Dendrobium nobile]